MTKSLKEKDLFETAPVLASIMKLALPSVAGQIILVLYNMADTFFVGLTGSDAMITAVTVCMPAFMFLSAVSNLFGVGGASVISRALGKGNTDRAKFASSFAFWGCLFVTLLYCGGVLLFLNPFVDLLGGGNEEVHRYSVSYMLVAVVAGGLVTALNTLFSHLLRAEGRSLTAGVGIILGGVLNIALDPLFMFVILPKGSEILGAALATAISNLTALVYYAVTILFLKGKLHLSIRFSPKIFKNEIPKKVFLVGTPACLMTLCENISYAILDFLMSSFGIAAQAGIGVAKKINMLAHCIVRGMTQGVLPLIGYNYACGNRRRMRSVVNLSCTISVAVSCICLLIYTVFGKALVGCFIQTASESHEFGTTFLKILCIGAPFSAFAYSVISFFQATGKGGRSLVLALLRKGILDIPLMFLLGNFSPIYGIVWATPAADMACCVVAVFLFLHFIHRHGEDKPHPPKKEFSPENHSEVPVSSLSE